MSVSVQLVIDGERKGNPFKIEPIPRNIGAFKNVVKTQGGKSLEHCDAADLYVYQPGTEVPIQDNAVSCDPRDEVPSTDPLQSTLAPRPLIVVAPPSKQLPKSRRFEESLIAINKVKTLEELHRLEGELTNANDLKSAFELKQRELTAVLERETAVLERDAVVLERDAVILQRDGEYYDTIDKIFRADDKEVPSDDKIELQRRRKPEIYNAIEAFKEEKYNQVGNFEPAMVKDSSLNSDVREELWPKDMFGNVSNGDVAHLIPNAPGCAKFFADVGKWAVAPSSIDLDELPTSCGCTERSWKKIRRETQAEDLEERRNLAIVMGIKRKNERKVKLSSLKQHSLNKIRLNTQDTYLDAYPCMLIIPLMTLEQVLNWDSQSYDVMVAVDGFTGGKEQQLAKTVAKAVNLSPNVDATKSECCHSNEIDMACTLLGSVVLALAKNMKKKPRKYFEGAEESSRHALLNTFDTIQRTNKIKVPARHRQNECDKVVRVSFGTAHQAPDPLLLAVKSAVVWSVRQGQRLLPACPPPPDDWTELDYFYAELELGRRQAALRPKNRRDLAAALGQL